MTKSPKKKICIYTVLSWTLTILAFIFRVLARLYSYDAEIGYFRSGELFPVLYHTCILLIAVLAVSALFTFRKNEPPKSVLSKMKETCVMEKIGAIVGTVGMIIVSIATVMFYWVEGRLTPSGGTTFGLITCLLSAFFFLLFWIPSYCGKKLHIFCGLAFVLHYVYILAVSYFELYTPMNNPVKVLLQITAIAAIFYLLTDLRFYMDISRPSRYVFSSILFLGYGTVSVLSGGFFSVLTEEYTELYHLFNVVNLSLLVPAAIRIMRMLSLWAQSDGKDEAEEDGDEPGTDEIDPPAPSDSDSEEPTVENETRTVENE